jgi:hypothetical protein
MKTYLDGYLDGIKFAMDHQKDDKVYDMLQMHKE